MDDSKSNSASKSPPIHGLPLVDFSSITNGDYNTGRLSKVTEENSNSNNTTNSLCEYEYEYSDQKEETSSTPRPESLLSIGPFDPGSNNMNSTSYIRYIEQLNRHNNTPHYNEEIEQKHDNFIPERIRLLLDQFATNGYIQSNAPPPANKALIDSIPERIIDGTESISECAICMLQINKNDAIKTLKCKHYFHSRCIATWLHIHASCPLCRCPLSINGVSETETFSENVITNRLQNLRSYRNNRNRSRMNEDNDNISSAATQLIAAVCDILTQYNHTTQNINMDDLSRRNMNERVVRFNRRPPPPPHSSRENTKTRISLPDLGSRSPSLHRFHHMKNNSSPSNANKMMLNTVVNDDDDDDVDADDDEQNEAISATKIKQDFAKWMQTKRISRLSINNTKSPPELTPENSGINTIIYNSNYNQNYIYNNTYEDEVKERLTPFYGEMDPDDVDVYDDIVDDMDNNNNNDYEDHDDIFCLMSIQQLEIAQRRHRNIINAQQCIVDQIQKEQNKRVLCSFWKCAQCRINRKAYMLLPCRHLGLCIKCNSMKKYSKCSICNVQILQKIQINFD